VSQPPAPIDDREARAARLETFRRELNAREQLLLETERRAAVEQLSPPADAPRVIAAATAAMSSSDELRRYHLEVLHPARQIACHEGCHWCCHMKVSLTAPEVFAVAEYLQHTAPEGLLETVQARAAKLAQDPRIFCADAKVEARIPCAMLSERGACQVYPARPLACRGYNSLDSESCRRSLDDDLELVPSNEPLARECAAVSLGLLAALADAGLPDELLELTSALHVALSEPNALQRWLGGEPIFHMARAER
jgi:Fe-S-cluster containining protein